MMVSIITISTYRIGASVQDHRRPDLSPSAARAPAGAVDLDLLEADPAGPAWYHRPAADLPTAAAPADDVLLLGGHRPGGDLVALTAPNRALVSTSVDARAVRSAHALVELDLLVVDLSAPRSGLLAGSAEQRAALVTGVAVLVLVAPPGPALTELARLADALTAAGAGPVELAVRRGEVTATLRPGSVDIGSGSGAGSVASGRLNGRLASDLGRSLLGLLGQTAEHLESVVGERDAARRESWIRSGQLAGALARERQELAEQHALLDEITELRATVRLLERKLQRAADRARPAPPVPLRRRVVRRVGRLLPAPVRRVVRSVVQAIRR